MQPTISIILGFRNRDLLRVRRCLDSINEQSFKSYEVIFVDYGSDIEVSNQIKELLANYSFVKYIYSDTRQQPWNRSKALNIGVKNSSGEYIMFSDIDIIFSKNTLKSLACKANNTTQCYSLVYLLEESFCQWDNIDEVDLSRLQKSTKTGLGGCHIIKKSILEEIGGYDEYYCFWGVEDRDLGSRLNRYGLKTEWLDESKDPIFHQWHESVARDKRGFFPDRWWEDMNIHFQININNLERNNTTWGNTTSTKTRYCLNSNYPIKDCSNIIKKGGWLLKGKIATHIIQEIQENKGTIILFNITKKNKLDKIRDALNKVLIKLHVPLLFNEDQSMDFIPHIDTIYIIWKLITSTDLITDYAIQENKDCIQIKLISL